MPEISRRRTSLVPMSVVCVSQFFIVRFLLQAQQKDKHLCLLCPFIWLITELKSTGTAHHFSFLLNSTDYRILLMDEDHDRMYVGSKDYILSLDLHDINKEPLIVRNVPHRQKPLCHPEVYGYKQLVDFLFIFFPHLSDPLACCHPEED